MSRDKATWNREPGSVHSLAVSDKDMAMIPAGLQVSSSCHPAEEPVLEKKLQQGCRGAASKIGSLFPKGRRGTASRPRLAAGQTLLPPVTVT